MISALLYLWNPLGILACVSGSGACFEVLAVLMTLLGGVLANPALCGCGLASSIYLAPQHVMLLVRLAALTLLSE